MSRDLTLQIPGETIAPSVPAATSGKPKRKYTRAADAAAPGARELPDASSIDATKIKQAVLTQQGYVCPAPKVAE